ncbi:bifunctional adenosylcobinamide kinase/adenosylcobinamide-phosphate guanylyltransferase [bacterium]|nr:bifunctional adenosylcobinamide kinase/adenosylcobinamide-phosphate guanylyltransferase [bacterium]
MPRLILVTGGARSGKSDFAQDLAGRLAGDDVLFVATAEAGDADMAARIAAHRGTRPPAWRTVEAPRHVGRAIRATAPAGVTVVDCLTLLVSNVVLALGDEPDAAAADAAVGGEVRELVEAARTAPGVVVAVTNEVGLGIVPANRLARVYRDVLGRANAALAREAAEVYLLVSGLPLEIKSLTRPRETP